MPLELTGRTLALVAPVLVLWLVLLVLGLRDLIPRQPSEVVGGNKLVWGIVIVLVGTFGPLIYFAFGRKRE